MRLSEHFTLEELTRSETAARLGIDNTPTEEVLYNAKIYLVLGLENVRAFLGHPVHISSGVRMPALNSSIPGSSNSSAHCFGYAADFTCPEYGDPWRICNALAQTSHIRFDQIIYEFGAWVHISFDPRLRGLTTTKLANQPYRNGFFRE